MVLTACLPESKAHNIIPSKITLARKGKFTPLYNKEVRGGIDNMYLVLHRGKVHAPYWVSDCFFILPEFRKLGCLCGILPECENKLMLALILLM